MCLKMATRRKKLFSEDEVIDMIQGSYPTGKYNENFYNIGQAIG